MAITFFQPEIWSSTLLSVLRKSLVFTQLANRDYEGEIANAGDTVHIVSIGDPTIGNYTKDTDITVKILDVYPDGSAFNLDEYLGLPLKDAVKEKWMYGNAARVFGIA
jgi:hypothetical protein